MALDIFLILITILLSAVCGFISIPMVLDYCKRVRLYDMPNARKIHHTLVPRLGGVSFMPSMLIALLLALFILNNTSATPRIQINLWSIHFLVGILIIYTIGIVDDVVGAGPKTKFVAQIIAAVMLSTAGLYVNNLYGLFGIHEIPVWIGVPLTILLLVFVDNAMNLIDGIDGLCASLTLIALVGFLCCFFNQGLIVYCILIGGLIGVLLAYLYFNVWGKSNKNRKIFMGDSGSLTLGFILGFLFVKYSMDNQAVMPYNPERMPQALSLLIVPTFDVVRVMSYRLRHHLPLFKADKNHIHHKLMAAGLNQHQALVALMALALMFILINYLLIDLVSFTGVFIIDVIIYTCLNLVINSLIRQRREKLKF